MPALVHFLSPLADLLLPPRYWATDADATDCFGLSEATRQHIAQLSAQPYCRHCGLSVGPHEVHDARNPCGRCTDRDLGVVRIARVGTFSEPLIPLVHRLKFARAWELAPVLAPFLYQALLAVSESTAIPVDALVPIPLHWRRRISRGFNQSAELAHATANLPRPHWPVIHALHRNKQTREQALLESRTRRTENLRNAFTPTRAATHRALAGKHLWLLDDVTTTGATLHAAATTLRRLPKHSRPASINALVLCVTDHQPPATKPQIV